MSKVQHWSIGAPSRHAALLHTDLGLASLGATNRMTGPSPERTNSQWHESAIADLGHARRELVICGTERQFAAAALRAAFKFAEQLSMQTRERAH